MIDLDVEEVAFTIKIIFLNAKVSIEKTIVALVIEINAGGIYTAITLINQDTMVLLQIIVLESEIRCLGVVIFPLVSRFVAVVIKDEYF